MAAWFNLLLVLLAFGLVAGICSYDKDMEATHRKSVSHHGGNCLMAYVLFNCYLNCVYCKLNDRY